MIKLSNLLNYLIIGNPANGAPVARLDNVTIDTNTGAVTTTPGPDLSLTTGQFRANKVWNAVWNDFADFQLLDDQLDYGKCYYDTITGAKICSQRCMQAVIGIASDTFGMAVGQGHNAKEVPIAVAGWVLAYVDREYPIGTPLTNDENGILTEMTDAEKSKYPERLVATYKKKELAAEFGLEKKVKVNGRHWVKVK